MLHHIRRAYRRSQREILFGVGWRTSAVSKRYDDSSLRRDLSLLLVPRSMHSLHEVICLLLLLGMNVLTVIHHSGCTQYCLRRKILNGDMSKYSCFQGYYTFCCCIKGGACCEDNCPNLCAFLEGCLCSKLF